MTVCNCTNQCPYCGGCCQLNHSFCNPINKQPVVVPVVPYDPRVPLQPYSEPGGSIPIQYG